MKHCHYLAEPVAPSQPLGLLVLPLAVVPKLSWERWDHCLSRSYQCCHQALLLPVVPSLREHWQCVDQGPVNCWTRQTRAVTKLRHGGGCIPVRIPVLSVGPGPRRARPLRLLLLVLVTVVPDSGQRVIRHRSTARP
jgi:hypothetical protein